MIYGPLDDMRHCNLSYSLSTSTSTSMVVFASGLWMNCPFLNVHFIPRVSTFDVLNGGKGRRGFFELTNESRGSTENEELPPAFGSNCSLPVSLALFCLSEVISFFGLMKYSFSFFYLV